MRKISFGRKVSMKSIFGAGRKRGLGGILGRKMPRPFSIRTGLPGGMAFWTGKPSSQWSARQSIGNKLRSAFASLMSYIK